MMIFSPIQMVAVAIGFVAMAVIFFINIRKELK